MSRRTVPFRAMDWNDIFDAFGGPAEVGRVLGITTEHSVQMKRRRSIAPDHWPRLVAAARARKIKLSYEVLATLRADSRGQRAA
jgi:hypothetical protein